ALAARSRSQPLGVKAEGAAALYSLIACHLPPLATSTVGRNWASPLALKDIGPAMPGTSFTCERQSLMRSRSAARSSGLLVTPDFSIQVLVSMIVSYIKAAVLPGTALARFSYSVTQACTFGSGSSGQNGLTTVVPSPAGPAISRNFVSDMPSAPTIG